MRFGIICTILLLATSASGQITIIDSFTVEEYVRDIFLGKGVEVFNVSYTGDKEQISAFLNNNTNIEISQGIVLASGQTTIAQTTHPFGSGGNKNIKTGSTSPLVGLEADQDLNRIAGAPTFDVANLEFDFIPISNNIEFKYVFASEEYPEFNCTKFNDVFAFLLSGPGYPDPVNIARLPNDDIVSINSVNSGTIGAEGGDVQFCTPPSGSFLNTAYYKDNWGGDHIEFDGMTKSLFARATVQPCQLYHIKLVVADVSDNLLDSGVFLEKNSFRSIGLQVHVVTPNHDNILVEGCGEASVIFSLPRTESQDVKLGVDFTGTASENEDFVHNFPDTIVIPAGEKQVIFKITSLNDRIDEHPETLNIIYDVPNCTIKDSVILSIFESGVLKVVPDSATIEPGVLSEINLEAFVEGNLAPGHFSWLPVAGLSDPEIPNPLATIDDSITYTVTFTSPQCTLSKEIHIRSRLPFGMFIPNAFSPNADNSNDHFSIFFTLETPLEYDMTIYDRWGTRLYQEKGTNINPGLGWDGTYKRQKSQPGVYIYALELTFPDRTMQILSGDLTLIR